jgi:5,10-methylenetetrahydromethanopterin reductase
VACFDGGMQMSLTVPGIAAADPAPVDRYVENIVKLRDEGFRRLWLAQMPWDGDLTIALGLAFREVDGIELGSAVIPIQVQHPMQLAQRALTLSLISGGRFLLGVGMSHRPVVEGMWGVSWDKPVRQMREYLDGLQPLLAGQAVEATGQFWTTRGTLQIPGAPEPDVYIAALGPQMLKLAGKRTAGTLTWMTGPKTLAEHVGPTLREAAAEAGRADNDVRVVASLPVSVTDDADGARKQAAKEFAIYGTLPSYRAMLDREGYAGPEDAAIIGDEQTVSDRLDELSAAGVDEFTALIFDGSAEGRDRTRALLRSKDS